MSHFRRNVSRRLSSRQQIELRIEVISLKHWKESPEGRKSLTLRTDEIGYPIDTARLFSGSNSQ